MLNLFSLVNKKVVKKVDKKAAKKVVDEKDYLDKYSKEVEVITKQPSLNQYFLISFTNNGTTDKEIEFFNVTDTNEQPTTTYRFSLTYETSYPVGTYYRVTKNGVNLSGTLTSAQTPTQLASTLSTLTGETWQVDSSLTANLFYVSSNTNVYTYLQIDSMFLFTTDQTTPSFSGFTIKGTAGTTITISWGDNSSDNIVNMDGTNQTIAHTYSSGTYNIGITGDIDDILEITLDFDQLTSINTTGLTRITSIDASDNSLSTINIDTSIHLVSVSLENNSLDVASVNDVLQKLDSFGNLSGEVYLDLGTNAAPTGAGITAKNNLLAKGWTVTTN